MMDTSRTAAAAATLIEKVRTLPATDRKNVAGVTSVGGRTVRTDRNVWAENFMLAK